MKLDKPQSFQKLPAQIVLLVDTLLESISHANQDLNDSDLFEKFPDFHMVECFQPNIQGGAQRQEVYDNSIRVGMLVAQSVAALEPSDLPVSLYSAYIEDMETVVYISTTCSQPRIAQILRWAIDAYTLQD